MTKTYKIGEAAAQLNLKTHVLRFWETEFPQITPFRTEKGQRLYSEEHLALLKRIRHLLHEQGLTIEGARKILAGEAASGSSPAAILTMLPDTLPEEDPTLFDDVEPEPTHYADQASLFDTVKHTRSPDGSAAAATSAHPRTDVLLQQICDVIHPCPSPREKELLQEVALELEAIATLLDS